jgi:hypothetical protein
MDRRRSAAAAGILMVEKAVFIIIIISCTFSWIVMILRATSGRLYGYLHGLHTMVTAFSFVSVSCENVSKKFRVGFVSLPTTSRYAPFSR